ncbi:putative N-acetyltransferase YhbS [Nocardia sp. GAS34]|uniref:GNAT family N-acetyltransferase n=1 Tax=unclassified Nocardia TaxID=2637762 RepID=UPI003D251090
MNNNPSDADQLSFEIRAAAGRTEFRKFRGLNQLAGAPNAERSARQMWLAHKSGMLSRALSVENDQTIEQVWATAGLQGAVIARSLALVAVSHGEVIGGLTAGPPLGLIAHLVAIDRTAVRRAVKAMVKIHTLAVLPEYERNGIGRALLNDAINTYTAADAAVMYGQVATGNTRFYRRTGFTIHPTGHPLTFTPHEIPLVQIAEGGESFFSLQLSLQP